jgi:hypothetical protein
MVHWKLHKLCKKLFNSCVFGLSMPFLGCKNRMRSEDWMPIWTVENRLPLFISDEVPQTFGEEFQRMRNEEFSVGCSLYVKYVFFYLNSGFNYHRWGNTPAMDVINLPYNEKDASRDFSLAFVGLYSSFIGI